MQLRGRKVLQEAKEGRNLRPASLFFQCEEKKHQVGREEEGDTDEQIFCELVYVEFAFRRRCPIIEKHATAN